MRGSLEIMNSKCMKIMSILIFQSNEELNMRINNFYPWKLLRISWGFNIHEKYLSQITYLDINLIKIIRTPWQASKRSHWINQRNQEQAITLLDFHTTHISSVIRQFWKRKNTLYEVEHAWIVLWSLGTLAKETRTTEIHL